MNKRGWSMVLVFCMVLTLLPFGASASKVAASGEYGDGLQWSLTEDGTLTVLGSGAMPDYTPDSLVMDENIDEHAPTPWVEFGSEVRAVVIGEGITRVGDYTFMNDRNIVSVTLPSTLRSVGKVAFSCTSLEELTLPEGLETIGERAFIAGKMPEIVIPASVTEIGKAAFESCDRVSVIKILGPVAKLRERTFYKCRPTDLFLSKDVRKMDANVFTPEGQITHIFFDGSAARFLENTKNLDQFHYRYVHANTDLNIRANFTDVPEGTWYTDSVKWAAERSFTSGTSATTFSPNNTCTRAQIVTFLWRFCGSPEMKNAVNPFKDVKSSDYFYQAVLWAVEKRITRGTSADRFSPNDTVTRAQTVTFFNRLNLNVTPNETVRHFSDVPRDAYYADAVDWAVSVELTKGISETQFGPNMPCTRAQIVTFLYRFIPI